MVKKFLVFSLVAVIAIAVGVSAYNVFASSTGGQSNAEVESNAAISSAPIDDPAASAAAQGSGWGARADTQGSNWQSERPAQGAGQGGWYGQGGRGQGQGASQNAGAHTGIPDPQAAQRESITLHGVVSNFAAPNFTLITDDGQTVAVQLGNQRFVSDQKIVLQEGEAVTLVGFYETSDSFAVSMLTQDASGQTYTLRDQSTGRPMWAGGPKNH